MKMNKKTIFSKINEALIYVLFFILKELLFILLPIIILILIKCYVLKIAIIDVLALPNFSFAIVVLFSIVISDFIKIKIKKNQASDNQFYSGLNYITFFLIISVLVLSLSLLSESNALGIKLTNTELFTSNIMMFSFGVLFLFIGRWLEDKYYDDLYDNEKKSNINLVFNLSLDKLRSINSNVHDVIRLLSNNKIENSKDEKSKHDWYSYKGKENLGVVQSLLEQIKENIRTLESELEEKGKEILKNK